MPDKKIYAAGSAIGIFNRKKNEIAPKALIDEREEKGGVCVLDSLVQYRFPDGEPANTKRLTEMLLKVKVDVN